MSAAITITGSNFEQEVLQSPLPVLVDFWAPWCGPCRIVGPIIDQLADEYAGRVNIGKVNVDEESELAQQHGIVSIPSLMLYREGAIVEKLNGAVPKRAIEAMFKDIV